MIERGETVVEERCEQVATVGSFEFKWTEQRGIISAVFTEVEIVKPAAETGV